MPRTLFTDYRLVLVATVLVTVTPEHPARVHAQVEVVRDAAVAAPTSPEVPDPDPERFAQAIEAFAQQDRKSPPEKGGIVFVGSSSVRMLDINKYFPEIKALNRGFGGAHISDVNHFAHQTVLKYEPSRVVFFCGNNDLWGKKSPAQVKEDFEEFTKRLFEHVPRSQLIVLALRPSPQRIRIIDIELKMNAILREMAEADPRITFLPGSCDRFLDETGKPRPSMYAQDRLHMNDAGYRVWREILAPLLIPQTVKP